jgi:hypothetical protein
MTAGRKIGQLRDRFVVLRGAVEMEDSRTRVVVTNLLSEPILLTGGVAVASFIPAVESDSESYAVFFCPGGNPSKLLQRRGAREARL